MKILFFSHYFVPEVNAPAVRTFEHCRRWVKMGHHVTVVTGVPNAPEGSVYAGYRNGFSSGEEEGIQLERVWTFMAPNKGFLRRSINYFSYMASSFLRALFLEKPDLVIATSPQILCAVGGCLLSKIKRVPFVLEVRDLWPESIVAVGAMTNGRAIRLLERVESWLYARADMIIALTESFKTHMVNRGVPGSKIKIVKNGIDLDRFVPIDVELAREKVGLLTDKFVVSYIGTLGMAHDLDNVLKVAEMMRDNDDILFLFVGSGAREQILRKIKTDRKLENVKFVGRRSMGEISFFYGASDVVLVTLRNTAAFKNVIPSKMFEIMSMERPYILSVVKGEADDLRGKSGSGIFCEPGNPAMMKEAIERIYLDRTKVKDLAVKGRGYVMKYHDRNKLAEEYMSYLKEACC